MLDLADLLYNVKVLWWCFQLKIEMHCYLGETLYKIIKKNWLKDDLKHEEEKKYKEILKEE